MKKKRCRENIFKFELNIDKIIFQKKKEKEKEILALFQPIDVSSLCYRKNKNRAMFNAAHRITQWSAFSCTSENMRITDCTRLRCTAQYARGVRNCRLHSVKSFVPVNADSRENASWFEKKMRKKKTKTKKRRKK